MAKRKCRKRPLTSASAAENPNPKENIMAHDYPAVADLIADALDLSNAQVSDLKRATPLLSVVPMEESSNGEHHHLASQYHAPAVGFRSQDEGREMDHAKWTRHTIDLKICDWSFEVDKAVADRWRKSGRSLAYLAKEGLRHLKAALVAFESQMVRGVAHGDASGFQGMADHPSAAAADDSMIVDAGGTTTDTGSSVYAVRVGLDNYSGLYRGDANFGIADLKTPHPTVVTNRIVNPGSDNKTLPVYYTPACLWLGAQQPGVYLIGRIINLTEDTDKGLTDDLLSRLLEKFPAGHTPTHLVMNRRSRGQLQRSRTTYMPKGFEAPLPVEYDGIPIILTDSVATDEPILI